MKKDMSEHGQINGNRNYRDGDDIYKTIDHRLNIKQPCDSFNDTGDYRCTNKTTVKTTRDVQIQTSKGDDADMTIKVTELHSPDNNSELENKLKRMEEENLRLRNRNIVLEDRIAFLEKDYKGEDTWKEPSLFSSPKNLSPTVEEKRVSSDCIPDITFSRKFQEQGVSGAEEDVFVVQSSLSTGISVTASVPSPASTNALSDVPSSVASNITCTYGVSSTATDFLNLVRAVRTMASPLMSVPTLTNNSVLPPGRQELFSEIPPVLTMSSDSPMSQGCYEVTSALCSTATESGKDSSNFEISVHKTNSGDLLLKSSTAEQNKVGPEKPYDAQEGDMCDIIVVTPNNTSRKPNGMMPELSIAPDDASRSRTKEISNRKEPPMTPRDTNRPRPSDLSVSPDKYRHLTSKVSPVSSLSESSGNKPITSFYKSEHYEGMELKRTSPPEPRNPKVRMYEKQLLGEQSPQNSLRDIVEHRRREDGENFARESNFRGNVDNSREPDKMRLNNQKNNSYIPDEKYSTSAPSFSGFRSTAELPRSSSDPSIFSNTARDKRGTNIGPNSNSMVVNRDQNIFNPNDIRAVEGLATAREYRHKESALLLSNENKIEKIPNPYITTSSSIHHSMQRETPNSIHQSMHRIPDAGDKSIPEIRRYDANRRRDILNSPSTSLKSSLKRTQMRPSYPESPLIEYEPLSKVSVNPPPRPPPLIPNPNLSPNRFPGRNINIPRSPVLQRPTYPMSAPKYSSPAANYPSTTPNYPTSAAKYNVSATNFHAISRANSYHVPTPNYISGPVGYPSLYENRLGLPQLVAHITSDKSSIIFTWDKVDHTQMYLENVDVYFLFAFHTLDLNQPPPKENSYWKRISIVNALPLPIACTLTQSFDGQNYFFAVAAVNRQGVVGELSNPCALKVAL